MPVETSGEVRVMGDEGPKKQGSHICRSLVEFFSDLLPEHILYFIAQRVGKLLELKALPRIQALWGMAGHNFLYTQTRAHVDKATPELTPCASLSKDRELRCPNVLYTLAATQLHMADEIVGKLNKTLSLLHAYARRAHWARFACQRLKPEI